MVAKQPCISVIMPVYNVENYVARAIESVLNQEFKDIELLIVDDGSTDRSGDICDKYAERDYRVEVFHTPNGGAPAARNYALDRARGEYVFFCDADDWISPNMFGEMYEFATAHKLELAISGFYIDTYYSDNGEHLVEVKSVPDQVFESADQFHREAYRLFDQNLLYSPWNKLFLRSRIEDMKLRFRDTFWDDFPYVLDFIYDVEKVGVLQTPYYHFIRERKESETARYRPDMYDKREEEHVWMCDLYKHWGYLDEPLSNEMVQRRYIERLIGCIENVCNKSCTLSSRQKKEQIAQMITSKHAVYAVKTTKPHSKMMQLMLIPIKHQNVFVCKMMGDIISYVKSHNTRLFATLKARR